MKFAIAIAILGLVLPCSIESRKLKPNRAIDEYLAGLVLHRYTTAGEIEYLLLKKANGDMEWQPAKGHVEDSDTSTLSAAIREVEEETGLITDDYQIIDHHLMHQYVAGDGTAKQVDMWPARVTNLAKPIVPGPEHSTYTWANIATVVELVNKRWRNNVFLPTDEYLNNPTA